MAAITTFASLPPFYANTSTVTTSAPLSCMPCLWLQLNPASATWPSVPNNRSALRTVRTIVDPNINSTYVTTYGCNTAVLSQYNEAPYNAFYTLDTDCNLLASYYWGANKSMVTLTVDTNTDAHYEIGDRLGIVGAFTTTDANGTEKCTTGTLQIFPTPVGTYTGRVITPSPATVLIPAGPSTNSDQQILAPVTSYNTYYVGGSVYPQPTPIWILPDLTDYLPDYTEVEQCTYVSPGPPPSVLKPVNELTEPPSTIPLKTTAPVTTSSSSSQTTSATPGSSPGDGGVPPTSTSTSQTTSSSASIQSTSSAAAQPIVTTSEDAGPTIEPSSSNGPPDSSLPAPAPPASSSSSGNGPSGSSPTAPAPPASSPSNTQAPAPTPDTTPLGNGQPQPTSPTASGGSTGAGGTSIQAPASSSNVAVDPAAPGITTTSAPLGSFIATGVGLTDSAVSNLPSISVISTNPSAVIVDGTVTISAGGSAITSSGVVLTVLPSRSGIVVQPVPSASPSVVVIGTSASITAGGAGTTISDVGFSVLPSDQGLQIVSSGITSTLTGTGDVVTSVAGVQVSAAVPQPSAIVIDGSATLDSDSPAATVSGVQFSLLSSSQGVQVVSSGSTTTILATSETTIAGVEISPAEPASATTLVPSQVSGFVLGGTTTLFANGPAATVSGTMYSVLPSNIVEVVSGTVTQYVIGGSSTLSAGGQATVSGTVYEALPSEGGVVVVVSSSTTTVLPTGTEGSEPATYTGGASKDGSSRGLVSVVLALCAVFVAVRMAS